MIHVLIEKNKKSLIHFTDGGKWVRHWLKDVLGIRSPEWTVTVTGAVAWEIPKSKTELLLQTVMQADEVIITQKYTEFTRCNNACKSATSEHCECACLGLYHGAQGKTPDFIIEMEKIEDMHMHGKVEMKQTMYTNGQVQWITVVRSGEREVIYSRAG